MTTAITNVFVLILENRSLDHMLGFSGIVGMDAVTGDSTSLNGLNGTESNSYQGQTYTVTQPADETMPVDPAHEFPDVVEQLCGQGACYQPGGSYPKVENTGFVSNYAVSYTAGEGDAPNDFGEIMKCFSPDQLPVLNALARAFAVCDNWCASMPGPTWPNRFFAYAASSGGLDYSPPLSQIIEWDVGGFTFPNGSLFDLLDRKSDFGWRIFAGDHFPIAKAVRNVGESGITSFDEFADALASSSYPWLFTLIEPSYGNLLDGTYEGGTSQHPLDGVTAGEALIKATYEAIRNSPFWDSSLLIITWDEHGGFYDHVPPPAAVAPDDTLSGSEFNRYGFTFERYGPRVPAVIVSPLIPERIIDHRQYDHASIPATVEVLFALPPLTECDARANNLTSLLSLSTPRTDAPTTLPEPAASQTGPVARPPLPPGSPPDGGNLPGQIYVAMRRDVALSPPAAEAEIVNRLRSIRTRAQAAQYLEEVRNKIEARRAAL